MAHGGLLRAPYEAVVGLVTWANQNWPFIDGKAILSGTDLEALPPNRLIHVLAELHVQDSLYEKEVAEHMRSVRADIMRKFNGYDSTESYGMTNDNVGPMMSDEPLPYIEPTAQTEDGYEGLDPPMG